MSLVRTYGKILCPGFPLRFSTHGVGTLHGSVILEGHSVNYF